MAGALVGYGLVANLLGREEGDEVTKWAVQVVSERVRAYCHWRIGRALDEDGNPIFETVVLNGTQGLALHTGLRPLWAVENLVLDGAPLSTAEFRYTKDGRLWRSSGWRDSFSAVELRADYGFESTPSDIAAVVQSAALRLSLNASAKRSHSTTSTSSTEGGNTASTESTTYALTDAEGFSLPERGILDRYRRKTWP